MEEAKETKRFFFLVLHSPEKKKEKKHANKDWIIIYFFFSSDNVIPERGILQTTPNVASSTPRGLFAINPPQFLFLSFL